ncbi:LysR family transcriptional regulator [Herbaspirillum sp. HC18]|nr:LysR family transcriptional regulator [Herbaspirillum sp. HC18]
MRFDLVDLRLFVNIVEAGSITAGAKASHLSPGSASVRLTEMEQSLGQQLLARHKRGVEPTAPGIALLEHSRTILFQVEQLQSDLSLFSAGQKLQLKVLCNTSSVSEFLPPLLSSFLLANPDVSIDLEERPSTEIVRLVATGSWHLGIISSAVTAHSLQTIPFRPDPLVAIAMRGHPLSAHATDGAITFADCMDYDFVGLSGDSALHQYLSNQAARVGRHLRFKVRLRSLEGVCQMVAGGVGIAIVPQRTALRHADSGALDILDLRESWANRTLQICLRDMDDLPHQARALVEHLTIRDSAA